MLADNVQTASPGSAPGLSHTPSPVPVTSDDVMKLPREDMTTFGRCPSWDNFVLVTCDKCDTNVKIEAFESHVTLRHGSKSERSAYHRVLAARAAASLQSCEVKLTPLSSATHSSNSSVEGGTVGRPGGVTPVAGDSELPSSSCTSPLPPITRSPSPMVTSEHDNESRDTPMLSEPMDIDQLESDQQPRKYVGEEADSTTNNVISIPDTHDMASMGIISEGQSLLDSMDSKFNFSVNPSTTADSTSISISTSNTRSASDTAFNTATTPHPPTHYITVSPLSKPSPSKKMSMGRVQPNVPAMEKKSSRDREYDPNKHCGVADPDTKKPCTRSLTCKSHSVYLKRKVQNRSGVFDELLANHKAEKEAAAKLAANTASNDDSLVGGSILERRLKQVSGTGPLPLASLSPSRVGTVTSINVPSPSYVKTSEDTLHYTTGG